MTVNDPPVQGGATVTAGPQAEDAEPYDTAAVLEIVAQFDSDARADPAARGWVGVIRASVANGNDLLEEAHVLHETRSSPRAFALAVLAAEEFGKAIQAFVVLNSGGAVEEVAEFERAYRLHQVKLEAGELWSSLLHGAASLSPGLAEQVRAAARAAAGKKMDAFYVDRRPDNTVTEPRTVVSAEDVHRALDTAADLSQSITQVAALLDTDQKVQAFWLLGPAINAGLGAAMNDDPLVRDQIIGEIRGLLPALGIAAE